MGGEEELNREVNMFGEAVNAYLAHIPRRCFARHPNDDLAFFKCADDESVRFKKSIAGAPDLVQFAVNKFQQCRKTSSDPGSCYVDCHRMLKEGFSSMFNEGVVNYPPYGHGGPK